MFAGKIWFREPLETDCCASRQWRRGGIYTGSGGALSTIAAYGQAGPGLGGNVTILGTKFSLGDSGSVVFTGTVADSSEDLSTSTGIFAGMSGGTASTVNATTVVSTT